jgi:hypothetical protein
VTLSKLAPWLALVLILVLGIPYYPASANPYARNIARAEQYLMSRLNPSLGLVYESDDPGTHWLTKEHPTFHWRYNQTYWLYSDNLFASLALQNDYPQISNEISTSIVRYHQPPSGLFEVVAGERIQLPLHAAEDYVVAENPGWVVTVRRHNSTILLFEEVDLWMYEALEYDLEGNYASAQFLVRRAETMWRGNGFWDWSFFLDHTFSNHKLALFLFTARALGISVPEEDAMEQHLWSMQNQYGGITSLSDQAGRPIGSANTETTALTLLVYCQDLAARFPRAHLANTVPASFLLASTVALTVALSLVLLRRKTVQTLHPHSMS